MSRIKPIVKDQSLRSQDWIVAQVLALPLEEKIKRLRFINEADADAIEVIVDDVIKRRMNAIYYDTAKKPEAVN